MLALADRSGALPKLQRIDADKVGQAGMENGPLGHGKGLQTPGQSESQGVESMNWTCVIAEQRLVELDANDVGYGHDREVESFFWIESGHGGDVRAVSSWRPERALFRSFPRDALLGVTRAFARAALGVRVSARWASIPDAASLFGGDRCVCGVCGQQAAGADDNIHPVVECDREFHDQILQRPVLQASVGVEFVIADIA